MKFLLNFFSPIISSPPLFWAKSQISDPIFVTIYEEERKNHFWILCDENFLPPNLISAAAVPHSHAITEGNCIPSPKRRPIDSLSLSLSLPRTGSPTHTQWQIETGKGCGIVAVIEREGERKRERQRQYQLDRSNKTWIGVVEVEAKKPVSQFFFSIRLKCHNKIDAVSFRVHPKPNFRPRVRVGAISSQHL